MWIPHSTSVISISSVVEASRMCEIKVVTQLKYLEVEEATR